MSEYLFSLPGIIFHTIGVALLAVVVPVSSFFGYTPQQPSPVAVDTVPTVATSSETDAKVATSSLPAVVPKKTVPSAPASAPKKLPVAVPPTPSQAKPPASVEVPVSTSTESHTVGATTLAIRSVPLLSGGVVHAGESVPLSYLQITNVGKEGAILKGFWVKQNGNAVTGVVIGLSTVDDKGGSRGLAGGTEGATLFNDGLAFAPTEAYFAPGQRRLFTIKAIMTSSLSSSIGTQLMIDVTSIETTAAVKGQFPIGGTTWIIE